MHNKLPLKKDELLENHHNTNSLQNPSDQEQNKFYKITSYLTQTQAMIAQNARFWILAAIANHQQEKLFKEFVHYRIPQPKQQNIYIYKEKKSRPLETPKRDSSSRKCT